MKRITAFILSIIYLSFAFGSQSYDAAVINDLYASAGETEEVSKAIDKSTDGDSITKSVFFKKAHKHLAHVAKVKLPRPSVAAIDDTTSLLAEHHSNASTHQLRSGTPLWSSATIYLKNCVFLI